MQTFRNLGFVSLYLLHCSIANADLVTLIPMSSFPTGANVNALAGPIASSDFHEVDIMASGSGFVMATKGGNTAIHDYSVSLGVGGTPAFFDSSYMGTFARSAVITERASAESIFQFSVEVPTLYSSSGMFSTTDAIGTSVPGNVELEIELLEFMSLGPGAPPPVTRLYSYQASHSTLNESLVVGVMGGDSINTLFGATDGLLDPTKIYRYRTLVTINSIDVDGLGPLPATDGSATAIGGHTITFSAVPEPSSYALLAFCGLIVLFRRFRNVR